MPPTPAPKVNMEAPEDRFTILGLHFDESSSLGERENAKEKLLRFKLFLDPVPVLIYIRFSRPEPGLSQVEEGRAGSLDSMAVWTSGRCCPSMCPEGLDVRAEEMAWGV